MSSVVEEYYNLRRRFLTIKNSLRNDSLDENYEQEFHNSFYLLSSLETKIWTQIKQLNPLENKRNKRGLINALGSVIKLITGNLDQQDAENYDKIIATLSENQSNMKIIMKDQTSLIQESINNFAKNIENLGNNQIIIRERIMKMENATNDIKLKNMKLKNYFLIQMIVSELTIAFQTIYDVFEKIEIAISFAKSNTFHNSIVDPDELLNEIKVANKYLTKGKKLPFEPILENILLFENVMEIKSYSKTNKIHFIIEIPIVEGENYSYYHLYPLPTPKANTFQMILPRSKYVILNEQNYMFFDSKCKEIMKGQFLCHETNPSKIKSMENPCEVQMLQFIKNITNCPHLESKINEIIIQKLEDSKWIIISPEEEVLIENCGTEKENVLINGTFLIEFNNADCDVTIKDTKIKNYKNSKSKYKIINMPKIISESKFINHEAITLEPIKLDNINLDNIKTIQNALKNQNKKLSELKTSSVHYNISIWTIIIYIVVTIIIIFILFYVKSKQIKFPEFNQQEDTSKIPDLHLPDPVARI